MQDKEDQAVLYVENFNSDRLAVWVNWARERLLNNNDDSYYHKIKSGRATCFENIFGLISFCHAVEILTKYTMENTLSIFDVEYRFNDV